MFPIMAFHEKTVLSPFPACRLGNFRTRPCPVAVPLHPGGSSHRQGQSLVQRVDDRGNQFFLRRRSLFYWTSVARGDSVVDVALDDQTGPSAALARSIKVTASAASDAAPAGMQNEGFWGIAVRPNTTYKGSFYAKTDPAGLPITASPVNDETGAPAASATITGVTTEWKQYTFTLKTGQVPVTANNHFMLTVSRPATVWFDQIGR